VEPLDVGTLIERCRRGDELAWEALVRRYQSRVYSVTLHYLRNDEEARDTAQDVFVRVYRRLDSFHGGEGFLPWLLRLARNAAIDRLRRRAARPPVDDLVVGEAIELTLDFATSESQTVTVPVQALGPMATDDDMDKDDDGAMEVEDSEGTESEG